MGDAAEDARSSTSDDQASHVLVPAPQRASILSLAASFAGRVITLPRTRSKPAEESDTERQNSTTTREDERESDEGRVTETMTNTKVEALLLPWQTINQNMDIIDDHEVRQRILQLTVSRTTYTDHPGGEEEYIFDYSKYKRAAKELLLCDPGLREMHELLVPSMVTDAAFWRNFLLRCNAVCVEMGRPPYLLEVKSTLSGSAAIASFQKFKREMFLRRQRSAERLRRSFHLPLNGRATYPAATDDVDVDLGDLDLDLDGEIEKELMKRRPSRAIEPYCAPPGA